MIGSAPDSSDGPIEGPSLETPVEDWSEQHAEPEGTEELGDEIPASLAGDFDLEADPADVQEQAMAVGDGDEEYPPE